MYARARAIFCPKRTHPMVFTKGKGKQKSWKRKAPSFIFLIESHRGISPVGYIATSMAVSVTQASIVEVEVNLISKPFNTLSRSVDSAVSTFVG